MPEQEKLMQLLKTADKNNLIRMSEMFIYKMNKLRYEL
jgi:hypothetical protein